MLNITEIKSSSDILLQFKNCFNEIKNSHYWHFLMKNREKKQTYTNPQIEDRIKQLASTCSLTTPSIHQWTPLHAAALKGNKAGIKFLLRKGVEVNPKDEWGHTPATYCSTYHPHLLYLFEPVKIGEATKSFPESHKLLIDSVIKELITQTPHLPKRTFIYNKDTHDAGLIIKKLLLKKSEPTGKYTVENMQKLSQMLGFDLILTEGNYFPRDAWIRLPSGHLLPPSTRPSTQMAIDRSYAKSFYAKECGVFCTDHMCFKVSTGATLSTLDTALSDASLLNGRFPYQSINGSLRYPSMRFYIEGGDYFIVTNSKGVKQIILSQACLSTAFNQFELDGVFKDLPSLPNSLKKPKDVLKILEEMGIQGLFDERYPAFLSRGTIESIGLKLLTKEILFETSDPTLHKPLIAAEALGYFKPLELSEREINQYKPLAERYLQKKEMTIEIMAQNFGVNKEQLFFIPNVFYHLDVFLKPWFNESFLVYDPRMCANLCKELLEIKDLDLSEKDRMILQRYFHQAELFELELGPLIKTVHYNLKNAGFTPIPTPGIFFDLSPEKVNFSKPIEAETYNINFLNALTGYSPLTSRYYYIITGSKIGDKLGQTLMYAFECFLKRYQEQLDVYFINHSSSSNSQFEKIDFQKKLTDQAGLHCYSLEIDTQTHEEIASQL